MFLSWRNKTSLVTEHQQHSLKGKLESSGATEHTLECLGNFNWLHCLKSIRIRSYSVPYFPAFGLNTERYSISVFSPNAGKYGPE